MNEFNLNRQGSKINPKSIGFTSFFAEFDTDVVVSYDHLIINYQAFKKYPNSIKHMRNILIILTALQVLASLISVLYIIFRRSFIYLFISIITFVLALCGIYGSTKMHALSLVIHCVFTTSITAGFVFYQIVDLFLGSDTSYGNERRVNDHIMMLIFTLPFMFDFSVGVYNYFLLKKISFYNSEMKKSNELLDLENRLEINKISEEQIDRHISSVDSKMCIICVAENRNVVLNPCGHVLACEDCAREIFNQNVLFDVKCPICRQKCSNYVKLIIS
jgi:hypothetical protein